MAVKLNGDGTFEIIYDFVGAKGLNVQVPENCLDDKSYPATNNFTFRNSELRSRPNFFREFGAMSPSPAYGQTSFLDANGNYHTVAFDSLGLWQFGPQPTTYNAAKIGWSFLGGPTLRAGVPIAYRSFANILYYANGNPWLPYWDGMAQAPFATATTIQASDAPSIISGSTGPLSIGGFYLGELDNHILLANVTAIDFGNGNFIYNFPQRLWWSANGLPTVWSPVANTNAGFNDFLDVPDSLTGLITVGVAGYLFRENGITFFTPSGSGAAPFIFDHLWASDRGIGNAFPWSIAQYGNFGAFVSRDNIYSMTVENFNTIGMGARDAIFADLTNASGTPVASIFPSLILGYTFLAYCISIPLNTFTRHYLFSLEDNNWCVWDTPGFIITGKPDSVWTGLNTILAGPGILPTAQSVATQQANQQSGSNPVVPEPSPPEENKPPYTF